MKKILLIMFLFAGYTHASDYISISDPRSSARGYGNIEAAIVTVYPKGTHAELGLYLTISGKNFSNYNGSDSLEIQMDFTLPVNSLVIDSWLWVGSDIIRGKHMDRWTASNIYENIVRRIRRDPSILTKNWNNNYNIKIYPLVGSEDKRAIKITYLVPINFLDNASQIPLPINILKASYIIPSLKIKCYESGKWNRPDLIEVPFTTFTGKTDSASYKYHEAVISPENIRSLSGLNLSYTHSFTNQVYTSYHNSSSGEGYFEIALKPFPLLYSNKSKRACIILDHYYKYASTDSSKVRTYVKQFIQKNLGADDYFNIIIGGKTIKFQNSKWLPATTGNINDAFSIKESLQTDTTGQEKLLNSAIDFINDNDSSARIILITSNIKRYQTDTSNKIIDRVKKRMKFNVPVDILDYYTYKYDYNFNNGPYYNPYQMINGIGYYGNEYFYINLCKKTGGNFYASRYDYLGYDFYNYRFDSKLEAIGQSLLGKFTDLELQIATSGGITYSKYYLSGGTGENQSIEKSLVVIGKYNGSFPLTINLTGLYGNAVSSKSIIINQNDAENIGSRLEQHWWGQYILRNENSYENDKISSIVEASLKHRILSRYTAFLCLEPSLGGEICDDCSADLPTSPPGELTPSTTDAKDNEKSLGFEMYPNPATDKVVFKFKKANGKWLSIKIYSLDGQLIKTFSINKEDQTQQVVWDIKDENGYDVADGLYIVKVETPETVVIKKLSIKK